MKRHPGEVEWVTLWSGPTQCYDGARSRKFSPPLTKIDFPTNLLRLEFNSRDCGYYTELDGVELHGYIKKGVMEFHDRATDFRLSVTNQLLRMLSLSDRQVSVSDDEDDYRKKWGYFSILPDEIIQYIFNFLDLRSLCSASQVCSLFLKNAYDPILYKELNLQPFWNTVDDIALAGLAARCSNIYSLNLSWTGGGGQITEPSVCRFLEECGSGLINLKLACCKYIGNQTLTTLGKVCTKLEELDLQSCLHLTKALNNISLFPYLRRLNLYSCTISTNLLDIIGSNCQILEHLNIGAVVQVNLVKDCDLNRCLSNLKNLVSLDLWRCKFTSPQTIVTIAKSCKNLEEIDIGWCHVLRGQFDHHLLFGSSRKLKKVFLTSGRNIDDTYLNSIATFCSDIKQFDILGSNRVTIKGIERLAPS